MGMIGRLHEYPWGKSRCLSLGVRWRSLADDCVAFITARSERESLSQTHLVVYNSRYRYVGARSVARSVSSWSDRWRCFEAVGWSAASVTSAGSCCGRSCYDSSAETWGDTSRDMPAAWRWSPRDVSYKHRHELTNSDNYSYYHHHHHQQV